MKTNPRRYAFSTRRHGNMMAKVLHHCSDSPMRRFTTAAIHHCGDSNISFDSSTVCYLDNIIINLALLSSLYRGSPGEILYLPWAYSTQR